MILTNEPFPAALGALAPDVALPTGDGGDPVCLSRFRGQPILVAFFSSDWDPSRQEQIALINDLLDDLPGRGGGVERVGVSARDPWCHADLGDGRPDVRVPFLVDQTSGEAAQAFGVANQQALFVIDADGVIRWRHVGALAGAPPLETLRAAVLAALGSNADEANETMAAGSTSALSRRAFVVATLAAALTLVVGRQGEAAAAPEAGLVNVTLKVNGQEHRLSVEPRVALLDALRERLNLTGTKKGCDHGQCGACTVHKNSERILSCLTLAVMCENDEITTIEGLAKGDELHVVQAAFIEHDGFQCGYCTPGQIMSAAALLKEGHYQTDADLREGLSGNLCRCGAYANIIAAVKAARDKTGKTA